MKSPASASRLVLRFAIALAMALSAGILLTASIAVSAGTAHPLAAAAAPRPQAVQTAPREPETPTQTGPTRLTLSDASSNADEGSPAEAVRRAWQRARELGVYHFTTDLVQQLYPAPSIANAGSTPRREELHLEGDVDLAAQVITMKLWQGGGSVAGPRDGAELRVERGKAYIRRLAGSAWQETADLSTNFAPGSDALALLAGIKDVREVPAARPAAQGAGGNARAFHGSRTHIRVSDLHGEHEFCIICSYLAAPRAAEKAAMKHVHQLTQTGSRPGLAQPEDLTGITENCPRAQMLAVSDGNRDARQDHCGAAFALPGTSHQPGGRDRGPVRAVQA